MSFNRCFHLLFCFSEQVFWDDKVEVHKTAPVVRNQFLQDLYEEDQRYKDWISDGVPNGKNGTAKDSIVTTVDLETHKSVPKTYYLDKEVRTWTDFKKVHYHPRSAVTLNEIFCESQTYDSWIAGVNQFKSRDVFVQIEEAIRFYAEECDSMQGFHLLCDMNNGFGGITSMLTEYLHDEFMGKSFLIFPTTHVEKGHTMTKIRDTSLTTLLTLSSLLETSNILCPLSVSSDLFHSKPRLFSHLLYNASLQYHSSALLACCLENATRPYRLQNSPSSLQHLSEKLVSGSRKLIGMSAAVPLPFHADKHENLLDLLMEQQSSDPWSSVTPNFDDVSSVPERCFSQVVSLSGLEGEQYFSKSQREDLNLSHPNDLITKYLSERDSSSNNSVFTIRKPIPTSPPFPHIFSQNVLQNGFIKTQQNSSMYVSKLGSIEAHFSGNSPRKDSTNCATPTSVAINVDNVPAITNMKSSTNLSFLLKRCQDRAAALKRWVSQNRHSDALIEQEVLEEASERFRTLKQDYTYLSHHDDSDDSD